MHRKFPKQVIPDADEVNRANTILIARFLHISPLLVDDLPQHVVHDALEMMWAEEHK